LIHFYKRYCLTRPGYSIHDSARFEIAISDKEVFCEICSGELKEKAEVEAEEEKVLVEEVVGGIGLEDLA